MMHKIRKTPLVLTAALALVLTSCGEDDAAAFENEDVLSDVEINHLEEGEPPEVRFRNEIDSDENAARLVNTGDGEEINNEWMVDYHLTAVSPEDGNLQSSSYEEPVIPMLALPALAEAESEADRFIGDALSSDGVTVGSDVVVYLAPDEEQGIQAPQLFNIEVVDQRPSYADGEEQEQTGDLPAIDSTIGERPELSDHDTESEAPEELSTEVLISGDGEEIGEGDQVFAQYRGWRWEDGEEFDGSWTEDSEPGEPFGFNTSEGVIEGWLEGIPGHHVGDRVLLVIPADMAYGETTDEEEGTSDQGPGGTLIFVIDIVHAIDADTVASAQPEQPEQPEMPELELTEEERERFEEIAEELGMDPAELEMFAPQMGITSIEDLEAMLEDMQSAEGEAEPEDDEAAEEDEEDSEDN